MAFLNFNGSSQPYNFWQQNQTPINPSQGLFGNAFQQENQTPLQPAPPNPKQEQPAPLLNNLPQENKTLSQYKLAQSQNYLDPLINPTQAGVQRDLFAYKNDWQNANDAKLLFQKELDDLSNGKVKLSTNAEGETVDTEKYKNWLNDKISLLNFHQGELAKAAEMTRNTAHALGIDTTGFNANNTLAESQQIMHTNDARAVQGLLNLQPVQTQMRNYYKQMRQQGLSDREARLATSQMHDEFRINNINQLWNGIRDYGTNGDGSLNDFGAALLGKLSYESPDMVELFANQYASPKETLSEANANERLAAQIQANALLNAEKLKNAWDIAAANQAGQNARLQFKEENANARAAAQIDAANARTAAQIGAANSRFMLEQEYKNKTNSPEYLVEAAYRTGLMLYGGDEEKALEFAQKKLGGAKSKNTEKSDELTNLFKNQCYRINESLINNDFETARKLIEDITTNLGSQDSGYLQYWDLKKYNTASKMLAIYQKGVTGEMTLEQLKRSLNEIEGKPYIGEGDQIMASLMNNPKYLNQEINKLKARKGLNKTSNSSANSSSDTYTYNNSKPPTYSGNR